MYFVDRVQAQGKKQRKIPVPKKFWIEFPLKVMVKVELLEKPNVFYVDKVQSQGKQRRIPLPQKFWDEFAVDAIVRIEVIKRG